MEFILKRLETEPKFNFTSLLTERPSVALLIANFLACLELARLGAMQLEQDNNFEDIVCSKREKAEAPFAGETSEGGSEFDTPPPEANP